MTTRYVRPTSFGAAVRRYRSKAGVTQDWLGDQVGLARSSIANIEKDNQDVPLSKIIGIADALDIPVAALFDWT